MVRQAQATNSGIIMIQPRKDEVPAAIGILNRYCHNTCDNSTCASDSAHNRRYEAV